MEKYTMKELEMIKDILEGNGEKYHVRPYKPEYQNEATGEVTYDHKEAVGWFNEGDDVSIWTAGSRRTAWIH